MKSIIPDISVENCKEALDFYKDIFGGEIKMVQVADGKEMFKGHEGKIIHSELHINQNCVMYFTDIFGDNHQSGNVKLVLEMESQSEIDDVYKSLGSLGKVHYKLQKTFWGAHHAVVTDKYGVTWELNYADRQ